MDLYHTTDVDGISQINPTEEEMRSILRTLLDPEIEMEEHPSVSLTHDASGWSLSVYPNDVISIENLDDDADKFPEFLNNVSLEHALKLWRQLAEGQIAKIRTLDWQQN